MNCLTSNDSNSWYIENSCLLCVCKLPLNDVPLSFDHNLMRFNQIWNATQWYSNEIQLSLNRNLMVHTARTAHTVPAHPTVHTLQTISTEHTAPAVHTALTFYTTQYVYVPYSYKPYIEYTPYIPCIPYSFRSLHAQYTIHTYPSYRTNRTYRTYSACRTYCAYIQLYTVCSVHRVRVGTWTREQTIHPQCACDVQLACGDWGRATKGRYRIRTGFPGSFRSLCFLLNWCPHFTFLCYNPPAWERWMRMWLICKPLINTKLKSNASCCRIGVREGMWLIHMSHHK